MPLTLLSGALIPTTMLPAFLQPLFFFNPLTYTASLFRFVSLQMEKLPAAELVKQGVAFRLDGFILTPQIAFFILLAMSALFFWLCVYRFDRADFSNVKIKSPRH